MALYYTLIVGFYSFYFVVMTIIRCALFVAAMFEVQFEMASIVYFTLLSVILSHQHHICLLK